MLRSTELNTAGMTNNIYRGLLILATGDNMSNEGVELCLFLGPIELRCLHWVASAQLRLHSCVCKFAQLEQGKTFKGFPIEAEALQRHQS